jgi:chain length determinant protein EpsF
MTIAQVCMVIRARWKILVAVLVLTFALTLIAILTMPKRYTAATQVFIDQTSHDLVSGAAGAVSGNSAANDIPTQVAIITSSAVAQKVVAKLGLERDPAFHAEWLRATDGRGRAVTWIGRELEKGLSVMTNLDSNVITISFSSPDPAFSAHVANAFSAAFIETGVDLRDRPARDTARWLESKVKEAREMLERTQSRVAEYQKVHAIVASDERVDSETERLRLLSQQLVTLQAQNAEARSKLEAGEPGAVLKDITQDPVISKLKDEILAVKGRMSAAAATFGKAYPSVIQMRSHLNALNAQLESETVRLTAAIEGESAVGNSREERLISAIDAQKGVLLGLKAQRAEVETLEKERDAALKAFQDISQRSDLARLLAHSVQSNVSILTPAVEPLNAASPRPSLYLMISIMIGVLLGAAAAFVCEIADRRIRTSAEVAAILGTSVLGREMHSRHGALFGRLMSWSNA